MDRRVFGTVVDATGAGLSGIVVTAYKEDLNGAPVVIGTYTTVEPTPGKPVTGQYEIIYDPEVHQPVVLRVVLPEVEGAPSQRIVSPAQNEQVNFRLGLAPSTGRAPTYTKIGSRLGKYVQPEDLGTMSASALATLSIVAGVHPAETILTRDAVLSAAEAEIDASLFYALGRGGLSANVGEVVKHPPSDRERALARAIASGALSAKDAGDAEDLLGALHGLTIEAALEPGSAISTPANALALANITVQGDKEAILNAWVNHTGTVEHFWTNGQFWGGLADVDETKKGKLKFALELDKLTRSNAVLTADLFGEYESLEELTNLTIDDWVTKVGPQGTPGFLVQAGVSVETYAKAMFAAVEDAFPTKMLAARSADFPEGAAIATFLNDSENQQFRLNGAPPRAFFENTGATIGVEAKRELLTLSRLYRLSPRGARFETMKALRDAGIKSATQVQLMGKRRFTELVEPKLNAAQAEEVYLRARKLSALSLMMQMRAGAPAQNATFAVLGSPPSAPSGLDAPVTWAEMFGGRTFCACEECQSAHGPAAYLGDLLFWLRTRDDGTFLDTLTSRRPDLLTIDLSCKNANTPLPTIDLILEQLEELVDPAAPVAGLQTTWEANELAARPEHTNAAAYRQVTGAAGRPVFYPFEQPYVAALDQSRTFLQALGVDRSVAMITPFDGGLAAALNEPETAAEVLGLTRASWDILGGSATGDVAAHWGYRRFGRVSSWLPAAAAGAAAEITLGEFGATLKDESANEQWAEVVVRAYSGGAVSGSFRVQQLGNGTNNFARVQLRFGDNYSEPTAGFYLNLETIQTAGSWAGTVEVTADSGWLHVTFAHPGLPNGTAFGLRISPAAGLRTSWPTPSVTAIGEVVVADVEIEVIAQSNVGAVVNDLKVVPTFLQKAGNQAAEYPLEYAELEDLLRSQYVQDASYNAVTGEGGLAIAFGNATCDIDGAILVANGSLAADAALADHLVRIAKLIRLSRDLGWSIKDTDRAIVIFRASAPGPLLLSDISESLLKSLAVIRWLEQQLGKRAAELLDWWGPIDTRRWSHRLKSSSSFLTFPHARVFNPKSANAKDTDTGESEASALQLRARTHGASAEFAVGNDGEQLVLSAETVALHLDGIAALAGVDKKDLIPLVTAPDGFTQPFVNPNSSFTLAAVSRLCSVANLSRTLRLAPKDLVAWAQWQSAAPDTLADPLANPAATLSFVAEVSRNATARLSNAALAELLAERGTRDLTAFGLPSAGVALLALSDELRAQRALPDTGVIDVVALEEGNLIGPSTAWTEDSATATAGQPDPKGGTAAIEISDASNVVVGTASAVASDYQTGAPVACSLWLKKKMAGPYATVTLRYGSTDRGLIVVNPVDGNLRVIRQPGSARELESVSVRDAGEWWVLSFRHEGGVGPPSLVVAPAAATTLGDDFTHAVSETGAVVVYAPAIADVSSEARRDRALVRRVAALLNLDVTLTSSLLALASYPEPAPRTAFAALLEAAVLVDKARDVSPVDTAAADAFAAINAIVSPNQVRADVWELVAVVGWLVRALRLAAPDLPWVLDAAVATSRGFKVEDIVLAPDSNARYTAWSKLREAARLQQVAKDGRLFDLFGSWLATAPSPSEVREALAARTNWTIDDLKVAIDDTFESPLEEGPLDAADLTSPGLFARLAGWLELARALRVPAASLLRSTGNGWAQQVWPDSGGEPLATYEAQANEIEKALRGAWGIERWLADMPTIRERLRERQREALVSHLVGGVLNGPFLTSGRLGEHLLMDVHMNGCARTSRLKDAIRTVQSFVQRVLLGSEGSLRLNEEELTEWVWRKNFRVWEANRKVFLYPENWLRPELRRDKTPLFAELETALASGDLGEELVEGAYRTYLQKLAHISKLEVLTVYEEISQEIVVYGQPRTTTYHVFARSRVAPNTYHYRTRVGNGRWSPWTDLPKIEGEHLLPVVYHRRLMLFWLKISETGRTARATSGPAVGQETKSPNRYFNVRLAWSELRDGTWSSPVLSTEALGVDERGVQTPDADLARFVSKGIGAGDEAAGTKTFAPTVLHGRVTTDPARRDLLVDVFRSASDGTTFPLGTFRVGAIDGHVTTESSSVFLATAARPLNYEWPFRGTAQRFFSDAYARADDESLQLGLPLAVQSTSRATVVDVLHNESVARSEWMQVTPTDRHLFDAKKPFVFEDKIGSYWVTYSPEWVSFLKDVGLDATGRDKYLPLPPSKERMHSKSSQVLEDDRVALFRSEHTDGTDDLINESVLKEAIDTTANITSLNSKAVDRSAEKTQLNTIVDVKDESQSVLFAARSGSTWDYDNRKVIKLAYVAPNLANIALVVEGLFILGYLREEWRFETFHHPHIGLMRQTLNESGVFRLIDPPLGPLVGQDPTPDVTLGGRYDLEAVHSDGPPDDLDFSAVGAYSQYNWEVFFHAPFLIACRLHEGGKFEEAIKWLRTIFDPYRPAQVEDTDDEVLKSYWRFRPFREEFADGDDSPRNIQELIAVLSGDTDDSDLAVVARDVLQQISDWRDNPFDPHAIARTRRITYMTAVVMKYLEVLLDWGDELFARDTLESIGEASEYYLLAARILGPKPAAVDAGQQPVRKFAQILEQFETGTGRAEILEEGIGGDLSDLLSGPSDDADDAASLATLLYFCVPANPDLASRFWDRVADRLFKVRNCLDIQGRRRELVLFEPPIDPDLLVRAAAAGVDLRAVLGDVLAGRVPHRRYLAMAELAAGLAAGAQGLGQALLGAIEKRDADQLNTLRTIHERRLQEDAIVARRDQLVELEHQREVLQYNKQSAQERVSYYKDRDALNDRERAQIRHMQQAKSFADGAAVATGIAAVVGLIPDFTVGVSGISSPVGTARTGGSFFATVFNTQGRILENLAGVSERSGRMELTTSGYGRRKEDWDFQARVAEADLAAIEERILATDVQLAMARNAIATAELRLGQIEAVQDFLERRFAREDLYDWLASQLSSLHYQSYQLAYEFAKKAEKAWQYELGRNDSFVQFGYWDSSRKGMLAADKLSHDLRRMQVAYTELSNRRLEIDQTFSMRELDPVALMKLKATGEADLVLPEAFFDVFYPGQYGRRIRAVRLSIPAAVPPNTNLPAHVELLRHWIRKTSTTTPADLVEGGYGNSPVTMTATSTAQRDAGVFEFDFRGPKLLPFEGAGAVSRWRVKLPRAVRPFDYDQIQDVHFHVAYDAEYNELLRDLVQAEAPTRPLLLDNLFASFGGGPVRRRAISLRAEHGGALRRFIAAAATAPANFAFSIDLKDALPVYMRGYNVTLGDVKIVLTDAGVSTPFALTLNEQTFANWTGWSEAGGLMMATVSTAVLPTGLSGTQNLQVTNWTGLSNLGPDFDITIVVDLS